MRDAALAMGPKFVPRDIPTELFKFLGSNLLFPQEQVLDASKRRKEAVQSVLLDWAVKLGLWLRNVLNS